MERKAVFMDIDGTLMEGGVISQRVLAAIRRAREKGHLFFVCTGRSKGYLPALLRTADFLDGFVMACGMHCEAGGVAVHYEQIEPDVLRSVAEYFAENGRECHFDGETKMLGFQSVRKDFERYNDLDEMVAQFEHEPIFKVTIPGAYQECDGAFLSQWFTVYDMGGWSDAVKTGVTKATGMQHILDFVGISCGNSVGVGDGTNDLPMIQYAGLGVAMGSAPEAVRMAADVVTGSWADDGVATMIERYVLGEGLR